METKSSDAERVYIAMLLILLHRFAIHIRNEAPSCFTGSKIAVNSAHSYSVSRESFMAEPLNRKANHLELKDLPSLRRAQTRNAS